MAFDYTKYNPPGVYTEAVAGPQLSVSSLTPSAVAIFGETIGFRIFTETLTIPADASGAVANSVTFTQLGAASGTVSVRNVETNQVFALTTDYTVSTVATAGHTLGDGYDIVSLKRVIGGGISVGTRVQVNYNYTDPAYYNVGTYYDFDDLRDQFGPAFDDSGNITSELTLAASLAFSNGAQRIIAVSTVGANTSDYINALKKLENADDVSIVTTPTGNPTVLAAVGTHIINQSANRHERRAILGTDGVSGSVSSADRIAQAQTLSNERVALVSPSVVYYPNSALNRVQSLGGQYLAAALAGLAVSISKALPLTRKRVQGLSGLGENLSEQLKSTETQGGLMVVESAGTGAGIRVRHGVTTSTETLFTKEWSIPGQSDALAFQIRNYLDSNNLIGGVVNQFTLLSVKGAVDSALESLIAAEVIVAFQNLKVRQLTGAPDVIEVRFDWQPSIPLNYIAVKYSINVTNGSTASTV